MTNKQLLQTQRVSLIVSKRCTLKCKLCGALAPYIKEYNPTVDFLKAELDAFFGISNKTGIIDISGGEPLLRGTANDFALGEILLYITEHYSGNFERLRIFTNGTVVPSDALCDVFSKVSLNNNFSITIDDYGEHSHNVNAVADKLKAYKIDYTIRDYINDIHCGGWVDLRDITLKHDELSARQMFNNCAIPQKLGCCLELLDGIMSPCSVAATRYLCGDAQKSDAEIIDLFADPVEMQIKLKKILSAEYFPSCLCCSGGMTDDSERFIPAEQATKADIENWKKEHRMRF